MQTDSPLYVQAAATLIAGIFAVAAAWVVASKQAKISVRQTEILARQVELAELKIRSDLFERRIEIYRSTAKMLRSLLGGPEAISTTTLQKFLTDVDESKFLFGPDVFFRLDDIANDCMQFIDFKNRRDRVPDDRAVHEIPEEEQRLTLLLNEHLASLSILFASELIIATPQSESEEKGLAD